MKEKESSCHPWGESKENDDKSLSFEDSFADFNEPMSPQEKRYVPLDDSEQYLAGLEKKLARLQGKTLSQKETERKRLISALAKSRQDHAMNLLNSSNSGASDLEELEVESQSVNKPSINAVDPQGTLGLVMRKCAPNHVALSSEELCELLQADILAKVHDDLQTEEELKEPQTNEGQHQENAESGQNS